MIAKFLDMLGIVTADADNFSDLNVMIVEFYCVHISLHEKNEGMENYTKEIFRLLILGKSFGMTDTYFAVVVEV